MAKAKIHDRDNPTIENRPVPVELAGDIDSESDPNRAGSIEQHLDMVESGPLRGDEILHSHGLTQPSMEERSGEYQELDEDKMDRNYNVQMDENNREGDEESGDEHSLGLQGSDQQELQYDAESPLDSNAGYPGEQTYLNEKLDAERRREAEIRQEIKRKSA